MPRTLLGTLAALVLFATASGSALDGGDARAVLDRYVKAIGGTAAIDAIHTRVTVYDMSLGWRINGSLEIRQMSPDRIVERGTATGWGWHGQFNKGFDGVAGWSQAPDQQTHSLEGRDLQSYLLRSRLDRDAHLNEFYPNQILRPDRTVRDRICHVVELTSRTGAREVWYLDSLTGLLLQMDSESDDNTSASPHTVTTVFDDYRFMDSVGIPFRVTRQDGKRRYTMTVTAIHNNVPLTSEDFAVSK